ncbi:MAG: methyltransferase type 12, partial [Marmoricola sp.]
MSIEPDTKDWTWVVDRPCRDCGFDPDAIAREQLADRIHENTRGWYEVLADADFAVRPAEHVWSRLEYACHVRDVHHVFAERVRLMLEENDPEFDNWDQDA